MLQEHDELLEQLGLAQYLSTVDLTKGYWQILPVCILSGEYHVLNPLWLFPL